MLRLAVGLLCVMFVSVFVFSIYKAREVKKYCKDVMTESGLVRGCVDKGGNYFAFFGVPYAAPPTGTLRFKAPVKRDPWNEVLEGDPSIVCPQGDYGVEDCLIINVFSPLKSLSRPLPVFVDMYGGAFYWGHAKAKGVEPLTKHNIIVITLTSRLGPLGYLCLGTEKAPGNAGMKDLVAGLKWIKQNIANFGGDPNRVTIGGGSSGGACAELLVLSPLAKGLFHQAIVESGSAMSVWTTDLNPLRTAYNFAEKLGIAHNANIDELADYYQRTPPKVLTELNLELYNNLTDGTFGFVPCVEKKHDSDAFLTEPPYDTLMKENFDKVPMMFFFSAQEGVNWRSTFFFKTNYTEWMSAHFADFLPADLIFDSAKTRSRVAQNIKDHYFGNKTVRENIMGYLKYYADFEVIHGLMNSVEIHSHNHNPVYLMEFAYRGGLSFFEEHFEFITEAAHGDVLRHAILRQSIKTKMDKKTVDRVSALVANFVKFGNPTPKKTHLLPIIWPRVIPGNISCLYLGKKFKIINKPHWEGKMYWDVLYSKYRRKILRPGE